MSKRLRIPILLFLVLVVVLLFFSDMLTGRVHHEFENPYSRTRKTVETRYGFTREQTEPSAAMERVFYDELKQPRTEVWVRRNGGYTISRFTGRRNDEQADAPPIVLLDPQTEATFLQYVTQDPHIKLAIIHSLYTERKQGTDEESTKANDRLTLLETKRVKAIMNWNQYDRDDPTVMAGQWWKQHAAQFGLTPEGTALAEKMTANRSENEKKE